LYIGAVVADVPLIDSHLDHVELFGARLAAERAAVNILLQPLGGALATSFSSIILAAGVLGSAGGDS